jgi:chemotaxis protein methyltransferase CheR
VQLTADESLFLRDLVRQDSAIVLEPGKEYLLESRLGPLMRTQQIDGFGALVAQLRRQPSGSLRAAVVEAMTTNETSFFRDVHPWEVLRKVVIPQLVKDRAATRQLTFLCAACSSGQEAYTLAIVLREYFPEIVASWRVRIIGTDLSTTMVDRTKAGCFSQLEIGRGLPAAMLPKYFTRSGMTWQARDELRSMIEARPSNLSERIAWQQLPELDGVFLRNVLIYFSRETKESILGYAHSRLRPSGFLMLGSSETMVGLQQPFVREQSDKTVLFRPAGTTPGGGAPRSLLGASS